MSQIRSFSAPPHERMVANELWVGSVDEGPFAYGADGKPHQTYLFSQIDAATRFIVASQFTVDADAATHERGLLDAVEEHDAPRAYLVDHSPVFRAESLQRLCTELGIRLVYRTAYTPGAGDLAESVQRLWRRQVRRALPRASRVADLNALHEAWRERKYHESRHPITGRRPGEHWALDRWCPPGARPVAREDAAWHRERRVVDRDGAFSFRGELYQVSATLAGREVELRIDPAADWPVPRVFLDGDFVCHAALVSVSPDDEV